MNRADQLDLFFDWPIDPSDASERTAAKDSPSHLDAVAHHVAWVKDGPPSVGLLVEDPQGPAQDPPPTPSGLPSVPPSVPKSVPPSASPFVATPRPPDITSDKTSVRIPCPQTLPMGARWREVKCEQQTIGFVLQRSKRRSIGFVITDDGLRVTAANWVTLAQIDAAVIEKSKWILAKLRDWHARQEKLALAHMRWQAGGKLPYLGTHIVLALGSDRRSAYLDGDADAPVEGNVLRLALPADADVARVRDAAQSWLQARAKIEFNRRLQFFLDRTGLRIKKWRLSGAATRWGSCTSDGSIMLNWRLIHFAPAIIDYVIAHELAHLREMNHSSDFWAEVGNILPDYEQARAVLRKHDPSTLPD